MDKESDGLKESLSSLALRRPWLRLRGASALREKKKGKNKMEIDFNNLPLAKKRSEDNPYASASYSFQNMINGVSEEMAKQHEEDERDNAHLINHDLDIALPSYEQDEDYTEDRYEQSGDERVQLYY